MSDEQMQGIAPEAPVTGTKKAGFLSTSTGKIVAIVVGLATLGVIIGIVFLAVFHLFGAPETEVTETPPPAAAGSAAATATPEVKTPAPEIANADLFTFRDIFEPLIKTASVTTTTDGTTGAADTVTPTTSNTLYLDGVVTESGVLKAQLRFNGASHTLAAGEAIPNSPWQVLRVSSTSVVMLYGDVQVTLAVGQGITK